MKQYMRYLPPIHELQKNKRFQQIVQTYNVSNQFVTKNVQEVLQSIREQLLLGIWEGEEPSQESFVDFLFSKTDERVKGITSGYLKKVINGTGTVLHTNLGRARLSEEAIEKVVNIARNYSNLEYDLHEGKRGSRHDILESLLKEVTGAEAAMVVNNNAAAVYLILRALAKDREVIVSRGQLVEIGGSFRVSKIMEESDAQLIEVGTTNKTHLYDYEEAINESTAMIMKVHTSNFKTIGFTHSVSTAELVQLKKERKDLIFYEDLGSGVLYDYRNHEIGEEPLVTEVLKEGTDLISFSGDKLLGGPQAGIIVGRKDLIHKLKKHQLARILRVDKMTFAALEATLLQYLKGNLDEIPTVRDILDSSASIKKRAQEFVCQIRSRNSEYICSIEHDFSQIGGGTMPVETLPTFVVMVKHTEKSAEALSKALRQQDPIVISRIKNNQLIIDFRTISEEELPLVIKAFEQIS